jgi:hypothetical protein
MSDKDHLWSRLTRKNPRLLKDPHFTPCSVRKFFDNVYDSGWRSGYASSQVAPKAGADLFNTFFGGKP